MRRRAGADAYLIWYGKWEGNSATTIIPQFLEDLSQSQWLRIQTTYLDSNDNRTTDEVYVAGQAFVGYPQGKDLSDNDIELVSSTQSPPGLEVVTSAWIGGW